MSDEKSNGHLAYAKYAEVTGGKTWDGKPMPTWTELPMKIQLAWSAAADEVSNRTKDGVIANLLGAG